MIERAYQDGVRVFVEIGPGSSCTRMIGQILAGRPHLARSACVAGQDPLGTILRLLASLIAERVPVDLSPLYGYAASCPRTVSSRMIRVPVGGAPFEIPEPDIATRLHSDKVAADRRSDIHGPPGRLVPLPSSPLVQQLGATQTAKAQAHEVYLRFSENLTRTMAKCLGANVGHGSGAARRGHPPVTGPISSARRGTLFT